MSKTNEWSTSERQYVFRLFFDKNHDKNNYFVSDVVKIIYLYISKKHRIKKWQCVYDIINREIVSQFWLPETK